MGWRLNGDGDLPTNYDQMSLEPINLDNIQLKPKDTSNIVVKNLNLDTNDRVIKIIT